MGNEATHLKGLVIEDKATDITDFWTQHQAKIKDSCRYFSLKYDGSVSVFKGEAVLGPLWTVNTPLEKFSNNLLKYRHPCIVRYLSSWQQRSILHLATEYVQPLRHVLPSLNPLQICIGLNNILRALVFLHEQASMSHNNICVPAIYVTGDGQWKLGGLQYLCPFSNLTAAYLKQARIHRYDKAVDPNEDAHEIAMNIDQYAFAVLVEDTFMGHSDDEVPHLKDFKTYCIEYLQDSDPSKRPPLKELLQHNFFNHQFISIYKFLNFLPLKSEDEKSQFFANILENLSCYDEETVAKQLGGHLLSRLSLLDQTARKDVIPYILKPKNDRLQNGEQQGFFSLAVFKEHVKPRLMQLFGVRDLQIRMLLLTHFSKYVHIFSQDELSQHVLPELLLGIKDTNDTLVSATLVCLSELVPILGADTVIGGKRSKLFTDGRPNSKLNSKSEENVQSFIRKVSQSFTLPQQQFSCPGDHGDYSSEIIPNERPSPVGGESVDDEVVSTDFINACSNTMESEDDWSDWENTNQQSNNSSKTLGNDEVTIDVTPSIVPSKVQVSDSKKSTVLQKAAIKAKQNLVDISELDIKNQKARISSTNDDFDFFADMKPVIEKPSVLDINTEIIQNNSKLNFVSIDDSGEEAGWGENWDE